MFNNLSITFTTILAFFGALAIVFNGVNIIRSWFKPAENTRHWLETQKRQLQEYDKKFQQLEEETKMILRCLAAILECDWTKQCEESRKEAREALNQFLIDR